MRSNSPVFFFSGDGRNEIEEIHFVFMQMCPRPVIHLFNSLSRLGILNSQGKCAMHLARVYNLMLHLRRMMCVILIIVHSIRAFGFKRFALPIVTAQIEVEILVKRQGAQIYTPIV